MEPQILKTIYYVVLVIAILALTRHILFMIGSLVYEIRHKRIKQIAHKDLPTISVLIPAFNEENGIIKTIDSVFKAKYDFNKLEVIAVDDGSSDNTLKLMKEYKAKNSRLPLTILHQHNQGKAHAMNNALKNVKTELVMTLDSDSILHEEALLNAVKYFQDKTVIGVPANVRIVNTDSLFSLMQYFEYFTGWQSKRALDIFNIEYIIGGIASTFRTKSLRQVGFFDTDTLVEDMDLTVKLINKDGHSKFIFGSDVIVYTEPVLSFKDLLKQRYRWKSGHLQVLIKHRSMFFSKRKDIPKTLTWVYLPYILFSEFLVLIEPLLYVFIVYLFIRYGDFITFSASVAAVSMAIVVYIFAEHTAPFKQRVKMALLAPAMYILFLTFSLVWYISLIRTYLNIRSLLKHDVKECRWEHVERANT